MRQGMRRRCFAESVVAMDLSREAWTMMACRERDLSAEGWIVKAVFRSSSKSLSSTGFG